ncbi:hypothetical protein AB0E11_20845 [Streptomyces fradiae]
MEQGASHTHRQATSLLLDKATLGELAELVEADELYAEEPWEEIIGADMVVQDLAEDLEQAQGKA